MNINVRMQKRILNEYKELNDSSEILKSSGIYFHFNEEDITTLYALMIGQKDTPYENGFYLFKFKYPDTYPMQPPIATYCTQGKLYDEKDKKHFSVRFNPNLYTCGKVCLSMLGTWRGPGWVPTNTIMNVLVAVQALVLNDYPLRNEPGFEEAAKPVLESYNDIIFFANMKISVLEMIEKTPREFIFFKDIMKNYFMENINWYRNIMIHKQIELSEKYPKKYLEAPCYQMRNLIEFDKLLNVLEDIALIDLAENMEI
jgi:ubiquitin-protein ligase